MTRLIIVFALILSFFTSLTAPASAQFDTEGVAEGDTIVVPYDNGIAEGSDTFKRCEVFNGSVFLVNGDDLSGQASVKCNPANDTRIVKLILGEKIGTDTYRALEVDKFTPNAGANWTRVFTATPQTSCSSAGSGTYVLIFTSKIQGGSTTTVDRTQETVLSVSGCQ